MAEKLPILAQQSEFEVIPLAAVDMLELQHLLNEEISAWRTILEWDFRRTAELIEQYAGSGLIPGLALRSEGRLIGYGYYLLRAELGAIGGIFGSPSRTDPAAVGAHIFMLLFSQLLAISYCRRIEGQLFTLTHSWDNILEDVGLVPHQRFYMARDLNARADKPPISVRSWENDYLPAAANLLFSAYQCHLDAEISVSYQSVKNCTEFLRNIIFMPGCGVFLTHGSAVCLDAGGELGAFILLTRIGPHTALIPQICVRPNLQGKGIGRSLIEYACACLRESGFRRVFLCVTGANEPARQLYLRHQFYDVQRFSAFYWDREK